MVRMGRRLTRAMTLAVTITMLAAGAAYADNLQADLATTTGGLQKTVDLGTIAPSSTQSVDVFLFVDTQPGATNDPTYPFSVSGSKGASSTFSGSTAFSGVTISGPGTANGRTGQVTWTTPAAAATSQQYSIVEQFDATTAINENPATITITFTIAAAPANTAPTTPGAPTLSVGTDPNNTGQFTLSWTGSSDDGNPNPPAAVTYTLQHRDANDASFSTVATGLDAPSYTFAGGAPEGEGTWTYRVQASDGTLTSAFSPASDSVVVDKSAPFAPTLSADRSPDYAGGGGWYRNSVTISSAANGDPALADGSAGSGVDAATVGPGATFSTSGSHTATDTVLDNATNESVVASLTVQVDATLPNIAFTSCPATVILGSAASASWSASDDHSGLASAAGGSETLDTASIGSKTVSATGTDNVGLERTASCVYSVIYDFTGFFRPIDNLPTLNSVKAGQAIPVKFSLNGDQGLGILATGFPTSKTSTCQVAAAEDVIEETVTAGGSSLSYDAVSDQYVYVWKTDKAWAGTCRTLTVKLTDGTIHQALFKLYK